MAKYEQHICTCTQSRRVTKQIVYKFYTLVIKNITVFVNATVETRCNLRQVTVAWKNVTMYFLIFCFVLSKRSHKQLPNNCKHRFFLQLALACAPMRVLKVSDKYNLLINRLFGECDFHIWEIISFTNKFLFSILAMISVNKKLLVLFLSFSSFEMLNLVFHKQTKRNTAFSQCNRGISFKGQNKKAQNKMASW